MEVQPLSSTANHQTGNEHIETLGNRYVCGQSVNHLEAER